MRPNDPQRQRGSRDWNDYEGGYPARRGEFEHNRAPLQPDRGHYQEDQDDRSFGYGPNYGGDVRNMSYGGTEEFRPDQVERSGAYNTGKYRYPGYFANRPDHEIEHEVYDRLDNHPEVWNPDEIKVHVSEKVVTLTGNVRHRKAKKAAWDCAWDTPGVEDVFNNLVVTRRRRGQESLNTSEGQPPLQ